MKMFRVSLAAILGAVASTTTDAPATTVAATTESPLAAAESARDSAMEHANQTLHEAMNAAHVARTNSEDTALIDQEVATIETAVPNTTEHFLRQRLHYVRQYQHERKHEVSQVVNEAKAAALAYKHAARVLESQRRHAGLPESVYEGGFDHDEGRSEGWHDDAENYGDAADNYIEAFFDAVEGKIEEHVTHEEQEEGDFDEDNNRGNHEHSRDSDDQDNRGNHERNRDSDAAAAEPDSAPDSDAAASAPGDDSDSATDSAVSLRAVAQNPRSAGQGFLLTFACIGFLASMAFAVQMQSRRTRSQEEPLLLVHD